MHLQLAAGTNVDMSCELLEKLADLDKVVAVKNSTGRLDGFIKTFFAIKDRVRVFGFWNGRAGCDADP